MGELQRMEGDPYTATNKIAAYLNEVSQLVGTMQNHFGSVQRQKASFHGAPLTDTSNVSYGNHSQTSSQQPA